MDYTLNVGGHLLSLDRTKVMGILNVTPDSFYASSRSVTSDAVKSRVEELLAEGADIIDIGACSTRPSASYATESEEMSRLRMGLDALRSVAPECVVSVDTFRADVARLCVEKYGVSPDDAKLMIVDNDCTRELYTKTFTGTEWYDARNYDICLDVSKFGVNGAVDYIMRIIGDE